MSMPSDLQAPPNQEPQEKKKWVEPVAVLVMALATHNMAWCSYQAAAWTRQSDRLMNELKRSSAGRGRCAGFRPESFSLLKAGCLASVSN
jgi:cytochrome c-type biogenesis protein CcmH/NrfG